LYLIYFQSHIFLYTV